MSNDQKAINFYVNHLIVALVAAFAFMYTADWVGLRDPEGPTVLSIVLVVLGVAVTGVAIYRGVTGSKKIARGSHSSSH